MAENFTQVQNLFDLSTVLNSKLVPQSSSGNPPIVRLNYTTYTDGRREIDGNFFIGGASFIADDEQLINLSDTKIFGSFTAGAVSFIITTEDATFKFGGATYDNATKTIIFRASADILTLTDVAQFYIRGILVPNEIRSLPPQTWGG